MKTLALTLTAALAATLAALAPAPASAQTAAGPPVMVRVADLDLATARGRSTLELRLLHAARTACGTPSAADPRGAANLEACVADVRAAAAAQIDSAVALARRQARAVLATR